MLLAMTSATMPRAGQDEDVHLRMGQEPEEVLPQDGAASSRWPGGSRRSPRDPRGGRSWCRRGGPSAGRMPAASSGGKASRRRNEVTSWAHTKKGKPHPEAEARGPKLHDRGHDEVDGAQERRRDQEAPCPSSQKLWPSARDDRKGSDRRSSPTGRRRRGRRSSMSMMRPPERIAPEGAHHVEPGEGHVRRADLEAAGRSCRKPPTARGTTPRNTMMVPCMAPSWL